MALIRTSVVVAVIVAACGTTRTPVRDARPEVAGAPPPRVTLRDGSVEFTIDPTTLAITSGGVVLSRPLPATETTVTSVSSDRVGFRSPERAVAVEARIDEARLVFRITSTRPQTIAWPRASSRDVRALALPIAEGLSIVPEDPFWQRRISGECRTAYGGLSMPFFGLDRGSGSFAVILASELGTHVCGETVDGLLELGVRHEFSPALEPYEVVFAPADGTPIGSALAYRAWLQSRHGFVSFADKARGLPRAERLAGALHAYLWGDGGTRAAVDDLARLGVLRALLAFDDDRRLVGADVVRYAEARGYLLARYDTFDSLMSPATADSPVAVFDEDLYRTGGILSADGERRPGFAGRGLQLSSEALRRAKTPFIGQRIAAAKRLGASAYFVDSDAAGELFEDFDPAHPMTIGRDRENRMERMRAVAASGFVLGSESAVGWSTPVVLFSHGNETIATDTFWRLLRDGDRMGRWWPPARPGLFFKEISLDDDERRELFDPVVRVPLFQAVFHDSVITTDRWEMPLMKAPAMVVPQTLFSLLYGVPTMWSLDRAALRKHGSRLTALASFFEPLHRRVATLPLDGFTYLSPDRKVQCARFGGAVEVIANFSNENGAGVGAGCVEVRGLGPAPKTHCP